MKQTPSGKLIDINTVIKMSFACFFNTKTEAPAFLYKGSHICEIKELLLMRLNVVYKDVNIYIHTLMFSHIRLFWGGNKCIKV